MTGTNVPGLSHDQLILITNAISTIPLITQAWIFGSRTTNTHKEFSDVDIALSGHGVTWQTAAHLKSLIEETNFPYFVDVVAIDDTISPELLESIKKTGITL